MKIVTEGTVVIDTESHEPGSCVEVSDELGQSLIDNGFAKKSDGDDSGVAAVAAAPLSQSDPAGQEPQLPVQPVQEPQPPVVPDGFPLPTNQPTPDQIAADMAALEAQSQPQAINVHIG